MPQRKRLFTDKWLASLARKPLKPDHPDYRKPIWDTNTPGLCVRPGAKPSLYAAKRRPGGKMEWSPKIGDYPPVTLAEARTAAREFCAALSEGKPAPAAVRGATTLAEIGEEFIETVLPFTRKGQPKRTAKAEERAFRDEVLSVLGAKPITRVEFTDIVGRLEAIAGRTERNGPWLRSGGPHAARKILPTLNRFFEWAAYRRKGGLQSNPMANILAAEVLAGKAYNTVRHHVPSNADLRLIWRGALTVDYPFGSLIRGLILTGQRLGEIAEARWDEIDEAANTLVIPAERMKNRQVHVLPLTATMRTLLDRLPRFAGDFIFSTTGGQRPISGFSKMKARLDREIAKLGHVEPWRIHDLRRAVRTGLAQVGVPVFNAELVIAHQQGGVHSVYDRFRYHGEKLDALRRWEKFLFEQILEEPPASVVPLQDAAA